jgi:hypothetical protein
METQCCTLILHGLIQQAPEESNYKGQKESCHQNVAEKDLCKPDMCPALFLILEPGIKTLASCTLNTGSTTEPYHMLCFFTRFSQEHQLGPREHTRA